jgi:CDP-diacylglycerol--glycerol-3-phosphate 3-phosphatidyltransferase
MARTVPYDASAKLTPANAVTVARLVVSPVLIVLILANGPSYPALALGFLIAVTDGVDGWLARRHGATRSGAFLDPLADKVLVLGSAGALAAVGVFPWLPVLLIAGREVGISLYRSYWARRGLAIPARRWAKVKTVVQEFAVAFALVPPITDDARWLPMLVLWVAVLLTLVTGAQYVLDGRQALTTAGSRGGAALAAGVVAGVAGGVSRDVSAGVPGGVSGALPTGMSAELPGFAPAVEGFEAFEAFEGFDALEACDDGTG